GTTCTNTPCDTSLPPPTNAFTISKSASPTSLVSGGTATYTVTLTNTSSFDSSIDSFIDVLPSGVTYQGFAAGSDVTSSSSSSVPSVGASGTITWTAMQTAPPPATNHAYYVAANSSIKLVYNVNVPNSAGTYTNSVTAQSGSLTIGPATSNIFVGP